jgi:hypothetical protein
MLRKVQIRLTKEGVSRRRSMMLDIIRRVEGRRSRVEGDSLLLCTPRP